ncbi:hypothetical protein O3P69_020070 [Scylla paramamosain]|uniref:Secreted protein n=1 Tax=Scylla paramamosain TaxID=85552 RepID=A0AAW0TL09_SCYPA
MEAAVAVVVAVVVVVGGESRGQDYLNGPYPSLHVPQRSPDASHTSRISVAVAALFSCPLAVSTRWMRCASESGSGAAVTEGSCI